MLFDLFCYLSDYIITVAPKDPHHVRLNVIVAAFPLNKDRSEIKANRE